MLQELSIRQFAIIDDIRISFQSGLTILSGETGAGKSIIINAVNLLLGSRASEKMIRTGSESAEIEALFQMDSESPVAQLMEQQGLGVSDSLIIRRVISRNNRHRVYINERLSTMQVLKSLTQNLASISGQHAHQGLLKEEQQLEILDQIGGLVPFRRQVQEAFNGLIAFIKKYRNLLKQQETHKDHLDLLAFQKQEIQSANIQPDEDQELELVVSRLKHAEMLYEVVQQSIAALYNASGAVVERITEVTKQLDQAAQVDGDLQKHSQDLSESTYQIEDVVSALRTYLNGVQVDERRLQEAEERLDLLNRLKRKYGGSLEAVFEKAAAINKELAGVENLSENIADTHQSIVDQQTKTIALSKKLSKKREKAAQELSKDVEKELDSLRMTQTQFQVSLIPFAITAKPDPFLCDGDMILTENGFESVRFLISPNVGEALKPMSEIASGGELSRIVLALKAILAQTDAVETVIFDEVDAGIGGTVAEVVGRKLARLSKFHQVICITHLPQIARFGHHQFRIVKQIEDGRTATSIHPLDADERVQEIARMLAGENITPKTLAHAIEMMANNT